MSDAKLAIHTYGNPAHSAIMLLHGFMSCDGQWLLNIDALAERYFLVSVELWGHGDSPTPEDPSCYSADEYARQFEAIRTRLGIDHWALIGQSYGAGLVMYYAQHYPQVCTHVVVTNSRSAFGAAPPGRGDADTRPSPPRTTDFDPRKLPYHPIHARRFPDHVKAHLVDKADAVSKEAVRNGGLLSHALHSEERMGALRQPVLLTNGRYEKAFQADATRLQRRYPDLLVANLDGGHSVNIEAAEDFNRVVLEFLHNA